MNNSQVKNAGVNKGRALILVLTLLSLGACRDGEAARDTAPATGAASPGSYVFVTQFRPEERETYMAFNRAAHEVCAAAARANHIVPIPFPAIPPDYVLERNTYASDGKRVVIRAVLSSVEFVEGEDKHDCEMRMITRSDVAVYSDGRRKSATQEDGKVTNRTDEPDETLPFDTALLADYTRASTVNGVKLKCDSIDLCIVDPAVAVVAQGRSPARAYSRVKGAGFGNTAMVTEPVSLSVGKPIDPALFALDKF